MSRMKLVLTGSLLGLTLCTGVAFAQGTTAPPKPQTPPASSTQKPALPPAATAAPVVPLPEGAKIAIINPDLIMQESAAGKALMAQVTKRQDTLQQEIANMQTSLQALVNKKNAGSMLSAAAAAQVDRDIDKLNRDITYKREQAQSELTNLQNDLMGDLADKVGPIVEAFCKEKGLQLLFDARNGVSWAAPGYDVSMEIVKRLDASVKK